MTNRIRNIIIAGVAALAVTAPAGVTVQSAEAIVVVSPSAGAAAAANAASSANAANAANLSRSNGKKGELSGNDALIIVGTFIFIFGAAIGIVAILDRIN